MKRRAYVSIGSNVDAERQIREVLQRLRTTFGELELSTTYRNPAVGFDGDDFLNLVVGFDTGLGLKGTAEKLRELEAAQGRDRSLPKFSARTIDLDLLILDNCVEEEGGVQLPRDEILKYAFVLCPLAELVGEFQHPETGQSYGDHWTAFDKASQPMTPLVIEW